MSASLEHSAVATGLKKVIFHSSPKEGRCQRMFKLPHNCAHFTGCQSSVQNCLSLASAVREPRTSDVQAGFRKGRGTGNQIAMIYPLDHRGEAREFQKSIYLCFIDYAKAFDCVDHNKLWKILKEMGILEHLTCLLRSLYAGQEATEPDMKQWTGSKLGKEFIQAVYIDTLLV